MAGRRSDRYDPAGKPVAQVFQSIFEVDSYDPTTPGLRFQPPPPAPGLLLAVWAVRLIRAGALAQLPRFEVKPTDPAAYLFVALLLLVVAALAGFLPARRAASVDPVIALRA